VLLSREQALGQVLGLELLHMGQELGLELHMGRGLGRPLSHCQHMALGLAPNMELELGLQLGRG
jgi:hypothetical protein